MKPFKKIPRFARQNKALKKRVGEAWRRPRGIDNKQRVQRKGFGALPKVGYRKPRRERGLGRKRMPEALVANLRELASLGNNVVVRIASNVGARKRRQLLEEAKKMGLVIVNR